MASYNKVILMGNLTRDVQLKHTAVVVRQLADGIMEKPVNDRVVGE